MDHAGFHLGQLLRQLEVSYNLPPVTRPSESLSAESQLTTPTEADRRLHSGPLYI